MIIKIHFLGGIHVELTFQTKSQRAVFLNDVFTMEGDIVRYEDGELFVQRFFEGDLEWLKSQIISQ